MGTRAHALSSLQAMRARSVGLGILARIAKRHAIERHVAHMDGALWMASAYARTGGWVQSAIRVVRGWQEKGARRQPWIAEKEEDWPATASRALALTALLGATVCRVPRGRLGSLVTWCATVTHAGSMGGAALRGAYARRAGWDLNVISAVMGGLAASVRRRTQTRSAEGEGGLQAMPVVNVEMGLWATRVKNAGLVSSARTARRRVIRSRRVAARAAAPRSDHVCVRAA